MSLSAGRSHRRNQDPAGDARWTKRSAWSARSRIRQQTGKLDRGEPVHIHVARDKKAAKFWLAPVRLEYNHGFAANEWKKIEGIVSVNEAQLEQAWHDYFKSDN